MLGPDVNPDKAFGLSYENRIIFYWVILVFYNLFVLVTTGMLFIRRRHYLLVKRNIPLCLFCAFLNLGLANLLIFRQLFRSHFPCFLLLWAYSVLMPTLLICSFVMRGLMLLRDYYWNRNKLFDLKQGSTDENDDSERSNSWKPPKWNPPAPPGNVHPRYANRASSFASMLSTTTTLKAFQRKSSYQRQKLKTLQNEGFFFDRIYLNPKGPAVFGTVLISLHILITGIIQFCTTDFAIYPNVSRGYCHAVVELIPSYILLGIYGFVLCPYVLYRMTFVSDAYGIKQDILLSIFVSWPAYGLFLTWKHTPFMALPRLYVPSLFILLAGLVSIHTIIIAIPAIKALRATFSSAVVPSDAEDNCDPSSDVFELYRAERGQSGSYFCDAPSSFLSKYHRLTLKEVLADPILLAKFRKFTITEFAVENLLFIETVSDFKSHYQHLAVLLDQNKAALEGMDVDVVLVDSENLVPTNWHESLRDPIMTIYTKFIKSASPYEININGQTRKLIEESIFSGNPQALSLTIFDAAEKEVFILLNSWSLPRFLYSLNDPTIEGI